MRPDSTNPLLDGEDRALYIHLADDGAVFLVRWNGEQLWTDRSGLRAELETVRHTDTTILYTREDPGADPPSSVVEAFRLIRDTSLPIKILDRPHPHALVPASERRTVLRARDPRPGPG